MLSFQLPQGHVTIPALIHSGLPTWDAHPHFCVQGLGFYYGIITQVVELNLLECHAAITWLKDPTP